MLNKDGIFSFFLNFETVCCFPFRPVFRRLSFIYAPACNVCLSGSASFIFTFYVAVLMSVAWPEHHIYVCFGSWPNADCGGNRTSPPARGGLQPSTSPAPKMRPGGVGLPPPSPSRPRKRAPARGAAPGLVGRRFGRLSTRWSRGAEGSRGRK